jgi:predicted amidohydrolase
MRVYCAQIAQVWNDPDTAFARAHDAVLRAVDNGADLVMFSEQYATGWRPADAGGDDHLSGDEVKDRWLSLAREFGVAVAGSYARDVPDALPRNVMLVAGPDGEVLAEYAKMHLFTPGGEDMRYSAGAEPVCFSYGGVKFGCAVCFDLRFPELFRAYLHEGCACVLVQAAWPAARVADWELLLRARALENRGFVAGCGCLGYDACCC